MSVINYYLLNKNYKVLVNSKNKLNVQAILELVVGTKYLNKGNQPKYISWRFVFGIISECIVGD